MELLENVFWACFAFLLTQENRPECQENRPGHQENIENFHPELSFECRNEFWTCFAILLSQENRPECQENRPGHQENREIDHSEPSFECRICKKRILSLFCLTAPTIFFFNFRIHSFYYFIKNPQTTQVVCI